MIRRAITHLRLYESVQILFPGAFGILSQQMFPDLRLVGDPISSAPRRGVVRGPEKLTVALH